MKKLILIIVLVVVIGTVLLFSTAVFISFTIIKPTTDQINKNLAQYMLRIVRIPKGIPSPNQSFDQISYSWEMETLEKEVIGVKFTYQTSFAKNQPNLEAILEMPEKGDASIFGKVLAAIISDEQSLKSAQDPQKANLSANNQVGYTSIELSTLPTTKQTTKIIWSFPKTNLPKDNQNLYAKLATFPESLLRILYAIPGFIINFLKG